MASIVEKNVIDLFSGMRYAMTLSAYETRAGILQKLDPRTKIFGALFLIILAGRSPSVVFLLFLYVTCLTLAFVSAVPLRRILRLWVVLPFFSLFLAVPLLFTVITPGAPVLTLPFGVSVSDEGVLAAGRFLLRIITSVSIAHIVLLTTRWDHILKALGKSGIPSGIIFVLMLTYRYIFVFVNAVLDMFFAKKSRTVGKESVASERSWFGLVVGSLMTRSLIVSQDVSDAMTSRGFTGEIRTLYQYSFGKSDVICVCVLIGIGLVSTRFAHI